MKQIDSIAGKCYIATAPNGGTVTDEAGRTLATVEAGEQKAVWGTDGKLYLSDDDGKLVLATFNFALAALGLLGGGADKLPAGYTRVEFLESTGTQRITTDIIPSASDEYELVYAQKVLNDDAARACFGGANLPNIRWQYGERGSLHADFCWMWAGVVGYAVGGYLTKGQKRTLRLTAEEATLDGTAMRLGASSPCPDTSSIRPIHIFGSGASFTNCKVWLFRYKNGNAQAEFLPALDPTGAPCMFDLVSKQAFKNDGTGQFIAGMTLAQAAQLGRKLPSTDGALTLSLPEGFEMNERVVNSLAQAEAKGWVLTIQTYAAETAAATYSLRRVWVRRELCEHGSYVAADGSSWQVDWCVDVIGADPESLGYERFRSVDAATEYWGLVPYEYPEELSTDK